MRGAWSYKALRVLDLKPISASCLCIDDNGRLQFCVVTKQTWNHEYASAVVASGKDRVDFTLQRHVFRHASMRLVFAAAIPQQWKMYVGNAHGRKR